MRSLASLVSIARRPFARSCELARRMRTRIAGSSVFGYTAAALSLVTLVSTPFLLPLVARGLAATGVTIDPVYTGGAVMRTVPSGAFHINIHRPVPRRAPLARTKPFVQIDFAPVEKLPASVDEAIDIDGDGKPDVRVRFDTPSEPRTALEADLLSLDPRVQERRGVTRGDLDALIARLPEAIVVRVPIESRSSPRSGRNGEASEPFRKSGDGSGSRRRYDAATPRDEAREGVRGEVLSTWFSVPR